MNSPAALPSPLSPVSPLIHLVDDDEAVRQALALLIGTVGLRVQTWEHPQRFLDGFDRQTVGAIVLDVRMPGLSGLTVLDLLRQHGVDQPVVMLTGHGTVDMCRRAFKAGAAEFLEKPVDDAALLEAVHNAAREHVRTRQRDAAGRDPRERYALLSPREREVLSLVVAGLTNKEIGRALVLSPRTVETHRAQLCTKLQAQTLAQMIRAVAQLVDEEAAAGPAFLRWIGSTSSQAAESDVRPLRRGRLVVRPQHWGPSSGFWVLLTSGVNWCCGR